jgi:hypothetical protein
VGLCNRFFCEVLNKVILWVLGVNKKNPECSFTNLNCCCLHYWNQFRKFPEHYVDKTQMFRSLFRYVLLLSAAVRRLLQPQLLQSVLPFTLYHREMPVVRTTDPYYKGHFPHAQYFSSPSVSLCVRRLLKYTGAMQGGRRRATIEYAIIVIIPYFCLYEILML